MGLANLVAGFVLVYTSFQGVTSQNVTCPEPMGVTNAQILTSAPYFYGDLVTYSCNAGFSMSGVPSQTCKNDSTWDGPEPSCILIDTRDTISHNVNFSNTPYTLPEWVIILICVIAGIILLLLVALVAAVICSVLKCFHRPRRQSVDERTVVHPRRNLTRVVPITQVSEVHRVENPRFVNVVHEVIDTQVKPAKEVKGWMPHSNPIRTINTSTK